MVKLFVLYGHPKDPTAFDKYYQEAHIPIAKRMKELRKWTIGTVIGTADGQPSPFHCVAELCMDSRERFDQLLASSEGQDAVADIPNYATGGVTLRYSEVEEVL